jgi:poly-gamma-glutamate capsule biosynthesis protein CapA/YwtB (metallophosphatase superfamily)
MKKTFEGCKLEGRPATFQLAFIFLVFLTGCQPRPTVTLALLGDLMLGRGVDPKPDSFDYLAPTLSAADLALTNLESPLAHIPPAIVEEPESYNLCAPFSRADLLAAWGIDMISLANNHRSDCGLVGPIETVSILTHINLAPIGPGTDPVYREVNGLRLAFLAFDDISSPLDENAAVQAIGSARAAGAVVIISVHWGMEYQAGASDRQKFLAQQFADSGAALVWGHHPHVLQPAAWLNPPASLETAGGSTLVFYSLGNALFDQGGLDDTRQSALVLITLDAQGVTSVRLVPFVIDIIHSRLVQPDAETAAKICARINLP